MIFWIAVVVLSAITLFLLAAPVWRKSEEGAERAEYDLSVFKDQLKELDKDLERGLISEDEAETARIEIQRRLLAADEQRTKGTQKATGLSKRTLVLSSFIGLAVFAGSLGLYLQLGMPGYQDVPYAARDIEREQQMASNGGKDMSAEIANLKKRIAADPKDIDAWMLLAHSLRTVGRMGESVDAFKGAVKESERHPSVLADYAEARIYANQGGVDEETLKVLKEAIQSDPMQLKARFYLGYTQAKQEAFKEAIQTWTDLMAMAPPQAEWLGQVRQQISMAADASGLNAADFKPSAQARVMAKQFALEWEAEKPASAQPSQATGPTQEQVDAAQEMTQEERTAMIRSMVERLANRLKDNPDDLAGWKRLAQVYMVLGEKDKAIEARNMVKKLEGQ
ncbi:c-type cytochrome biogenesis protein CcmI [Terasakiella sp. SH-1]|uniref:c-type cytochrome biogenesis protein CcmI n=1 Tax=Terasakiella sp. SH-1 TaxID=2560057 RepID=UPI00107450A4|nr:c-type cytochrome biogenesis protein CcmI [Terasakiella sp. SH-1]